MTGPTVPRVLHIPTVYGDGVAAAAEPDMALLAVELYGLIRADPAQRRPLLAWDSALAAVAAARVADMRLRRYFAHVDPDGSGPNRALMLAGIHLPSDYDRAADGNNVESIINNVDHAPDAWAALKTSPPHAAHLLGAGWFQGQTRMGVACDRGYDHGHWWIWCILTCH